MRRGRGGRTRRATRGLSPAVEDTAWYLVIGALLIGMALADAFLKRLPLTSSMFYLAIGALLGPWWGDLLHVDPVDDARLLERFTEVAVLISLFTAGLKLRLPLLDPRWRPVWRLAFVAMVLTVGAVACAGMWLFALPFGAAILLGGVLAPTDPVLAADVQVTGADDAERVRFSLTGEAGMNDGTAFPFVMLGLGLLGMHDLGATGWRWVLVDVLWAVTGGIAVGVVCGTTVGKLVLRSRLRNQYVAGLDNFVALGTIALAYGLALLVQAYGFLAVFAAGLGLRRLEREYARHHVHEATQGEPHMTPAEVAHAVLQVNEQLERMAEVAVVLVVGAALASVSWPDGVEWFVPLLFLAIRPLSVALSLAGEHLSRVQKLLIAWFGVRGIGSIYYLAFALRHGAAAEHARLLTDITLVTISVSVVVHGISVTPMMDAYSKRRERRRG